MEIRREYQQMMTLEAFAEENGLTLVISERTLPTEQKGLFGERFAFRVSSYRRRNGLSNG